MKSTGIIRKVDELGRVTIPMEIRNQMEIYEKDPLEILVDGQKIVLKKYETSCIFCGNSKAIKEIMEKNICSKCITEISKLV